MRSALLQQAAQSATPAAAAAAQARAANTAEEAQLDARIELAAKKAALAGLEAQVGPVIAGVPMPPGMPTGRIVIERDGKTIILDNPTAEQIAAVGGAGTQLPPVEGWALVAVTGMTLAGIIIVTTLVLKYFRSRHQSQPAAGGAQAEARMARIENAIESIAVEVERISENQRYTSKLLAEGAAVPVGVGDRNDAVLQPQRGN